MLPTTPRPKLIAIAAMASNRVIGREGKLPWHLPEDLKFFKQTTLGHPVLMGRKTFESIIERLGKPLPGRANIVLSQSMPPREGVQIIRDLAQLQAFLPHLPSPVYLVGGAQLYESLFHECDELLLTYIEKPCEGDMLLPKFEDAFDLKEVVLRGAGFEIRRYVRRV
jgi:dihydrofolate reductase